MPSTRSIGTYLQSVLNDLGYKASVKAISSNIQFTYIQNTNNKVQISVTQWYQDYPAASDFLNILFGCELVPSEARIPRSTSPASATRRSTAKMQAALELGVTDPAAADKLWAEIDKAVMAKAPAVPLFTPKHVDFVSKRVGNFQFNSQYLLDRHPVLGAVGAAPRRDGVASGGHDGSRRRRTICRTRHSPPASRGPWATAVAQA